MFVAGTETTSTVVEWAMSELMRNPEIMERAQKEVRELAAQRRNRLEESDISELNYMKLIINETLRLHPPVPLVPRLCRETCEVMGYRIDAGTRVFVNAWANGRDERYWDDAESFKPERFQGSAMDFKGVDFEYLPFGAGRRICPGIGFGMATVELALGHLLLHFDWELPHGMRPEELDMCEATSLIVARKTELKLIATGRVPLPAAT
ncbi:Cytochrome P450 [Musa troglodytarum]|uniref:Cytochrome P450 n=6 Tax=Musa troglodytarum TaxID=320322 RepID=A0A9E7K761_9LILI|nr:Cytochrome P450 [Musa troglodytarum]